MAENDQTEYKKRQTAYKIKIKHIVNGSFAKNGESINSVQTELGPVSRVNIIGFVISKEASDYFSGVVVDDGTERISVRSFENKKMFDDFDVGEVVNVIGRIRVYGEEKYVSAEIVKNIDGLWLEHRKNEMELLEKIYKKNKKSEFPEPVPENLNLKNEEEVVDSEEVSEIDKIIGLIKKHDSGQGADTSEVIKNSENPNCEKIINELLRSGDVFAIRPGRIKILE